MASGLNQIQLQNLFKFLTTHCLSFVSPFCSFSLSRKWNVKVSGKKVLKNSMNRSKVLHLVSLSWIAVVTLRAKLWAPSCSEQNCNTPKITSGSGSSSGNSTNNNVDSSPGDSDNYILFEDSFQIEISMICVPFPIQLTQNDQWTFNSLPDRANNHRNRFTVK